MSKKLQGIYPVIPTPFDAQKKIDAESLKSLVEFEIAAGAHGLALLGNLGEVHRLSDAERKLVIELVIKHAKGRIPIVCGTGASGTDLAIGYIREAQELGADALMIAPPRLPKPNDDAVFNYYQSISAEVSIPIIIQDEPVTYGVHLSPSLISRLSDLQGVEYIKLEDAPTLPKITRIKKLTGNRLGIFGGLSGLFTFEELGRGACGIMTGFAYPELLVRIYREFTEGDKKLAREIFYRILPMIRYEAQPLLSLPIRKEIFKRRGIIKTSIAREPVATLDQESLREIDEIGEATGLTKFAAV